VTATNHVLTGSVIAAAIQQPLIALPLALLSHVICDALPHFGKHPKLKQTSHNFVIYLATDCGIAAFILLAILMLKPAYWPLLIACGILAALPDVLWLPQYIRVINGKKRRLNRLTSFLSVIQNESPVFGMLFEVGWASVMLWALLVYIF
jgi:hypothetical protein